jgi:hypothetical protein
MKANENDIEIYSDWCYYLVAFLDVLGQKEIFAKLSEIRTIEEIDNGIKKDISENLYYLEQLRKNFKEYFNEYTGEEASSVRVDESCKEMFDQMRKAEIYFQYFSDSLIAFVPLEFGSFYSVTLNGVWGVLGACGLAVLGSLAVEHAVRGGIEICWGTRLKSGEIYGPALSKAYHLESKVAGYPRIVVGDEVRNYLNSLSNKVKQHPAQKQIDIDACQRMADRCLKLIAEDNDGHLLLDYLGPGFLELNKGSQDFFCMYDLSRKFVYDSLFKWKKENNTYLASKYQQLCDYFRAKSILIEEARKSSSGN